MLGKKINIDQAIDVRYVDIPTQKKIILYKNNIKVLRDAKENNDSNEVLFVKRW